MIREELSINRYSFPKVIDISEENIPPKDQSTNVNLATYFHVFFQDKSFPSPIIKQSEPIKTPEEHRRQALDKSLLRLSTLDISGKECVEEYLRHQYRRNFKASTIRGSYTGLSYFAKFLQEIGRKRITDITKTDLEAFVEHEQDRRIKISTVSLRLAQVKAFLRFMIDGGYISKDVFPWKLTIRKPDPLPRAMDPDDVDKLLAVNGGVRDRAMVLLLLRTGMRIGELLSTRIIDVNMREKKILIYEGEKNQRGRAVYFCNDAKAALEVWMKERKPWYELIFYGQRGRMLTYPAARMAFIKYLASAGLTHKGYTLHCLRHTYATDLINARMPLECLGKLMGHSRLDVTRRYAMLTDKTREEEYFKAMEIIERRERDDNYECDSELQALLKKT